MAGNPSAAEASVATLEKQVAALERSVAPRPPGWAWLLVVLGLLMAVGLSAHAATAFTTIQRINQNSNIPTNNPILVFQDIATNGPRVSANVESSSRNAYAQALTQYALDGTAVCLGLALAFAGVFIRLNR